MPKSVLQYTQACLSAMNSDLVDAIADTSESMQVASLLEEVYAELMNREDWAFLFSPIALTGAGDSNFPTKFTIPENVRFIETVRYDIAGLTGEYKPREMLYLHPEEFVQRYGNLPDRSETNLVTLGNQIKFYVYNNRQPSVWTSFDDLTIYMDGVNTSITSTLTSGRVSAWGVINPSFSVTDGFVPLIPTQMEPLLQAELNRQAFEYFKQTNSKTDEAKAQRQLAQARRRDSRITRQDAIAYHVGYGRGGGLASNSSQGILSRQTY